MPINPLRGWQGDRDALVSVGTGLECVLADAEGSLVAITPDGEVLTLSGLAPAHWGWPR